MLFSRTIGLPVITGDDATSLGTVRDLTTDAAGAVVAGVRLSGAGPHGRAALDRRGGGGSRRADRPLPARRRPGADPAARASQPARQPRAGPISEPEHGTVQDIAFDAASGRVLTLYTALGDIPGARLLGLGPYALVVRAQPWPPRGRQ
ncbi:PRC-barrel domain-containing protein [Streptomyces tricolor]|nr:PRC-barrel domain-containing protein [Streptomyces tricolor]